MRAVLVLPVVGAVALAGLMGGCTHMTSYITPAPKPFGTTAEGAEVKQVKIWNKHGMSATILAYGGVVQDLEVPGRVASDGKVKSSNVVLGFDTLPMYETQSPFFGALIGRTGNRIAKGEFTLEGKTYHLPINDPPNDLHGGDKGYDKRVWALKRFSVMGQPSAILTLTDPDGMEGFPGNVKVTVIYTLTRDNALRIEYHATTDQPTPINLTHHSYFNLKDGGASDIMGHVVQLNADAYTPVDATLIPTGEIAPVAGTPFDFTKAKPVGQDFSQTPNGYDHNFVVSADAPSMTDVASGMRLREAAVVTEPTSGRKMEVWTSEPGLQFYSGNMMKEVTGKGGVKYEKHYAFCMEAQHYPDSPNQPKFPSVIVRPGEEYVQVTEYRFSVVK